MNASQGFSHLDTTYSFVYNEGGNIVSKTEYVYTTGELGTPTKTYAYAKEENYEENLFDMFDYFNSVYNL